MIGILRLMSRISFLCTWRHVFSSLSGIYKNWMKIKDHEYSKAFSIRSVEPNAVKRYNLEIYISNITADSSDACILLYLLLLLLFSLVRKSANKNVKNKLIFNTAIHKRSNKINLWNIFKKLKIPYVWSYEETNGSGRKHIGICTPIKTPAMSKRPSFYYWKKKK